MAEYTSKASGGFDQEGATTWNEAGHPGAGDNVTIQNGHTVFLESATTITDLTIDAGGELTTEDGGNHRNLTVTGSTSISGTMTCTGTSENSFQAVTVNDGGTLAIGTSDTAIEGNLIIGGGTSGLISFGSDGTLDFNGGSITINSGATLGTADTDYNIDIGGDMAASAGTFIAPNATGDLIFRTGNTWNTPSTYTHSSGEWTVIGSGTATLNTNFTDLYDIEVANFATLAIGAHNVTVANQFKIGGGVSGTVTIDTGVVTIGGQLWIGSGASFGSANKAYTLDITGNLNAPTGTVIAPNGSGTFNLSGGFTCGTFTHSSGKIVLNGSSQSITGSQTFHDFDKHVEAADTITCENGETITVEGQLDLYGASGELLSVESDSGGSTFALVLTGTKGTIQYLSVKDSDASGSDADVLPIAPSNSVNGGNTSGWFVDFIPQVIVIT